jgi:type I restriction enzyme, S subunit
MARYKFSDIAYNITDKMMPVPEDKDTYIGLEHMDSGSLSINRYGSEVVLKGQKLVMKKGDILFGRRNAYLKRAAIAPHDGLFSAHGMILRPKKEVVNEKFFPFLIASDYFMDTAIQISVGSLSPTVNWGTLKNVEFNLPDMKEQEELAELLWAANNTREAYKKLLTLTDDLVKARFIEMFGDPETNKKGWKKCNLGEVAKLQGGYAFKSSEYVNMGVRLVQIANVNKDNLDWNTINYLPDEYINKYHRFALNEGDIVMAMTRPIIKSIDSVKIAVVSREDVPSLLNQRVGRFIRSSKEINDRYLLEFCKSDYFKNLIDVYSQNSLQPNVSSAQVESIKILCPPLTLQNQFANFVIQVEKSKYKLEQSILSFENTLKSLMKQYIG